MRTSENLTTEIRRSQGPSVYQDYSCVFDNQSLSKKVTFGDAKRKSQYTSCDGKWKMCQRRLLLRLNFISFTSNFLKLRLESSLSSQWQFKRGLL